MRYLTGNRIFACCVFEYDADATVEFEVETPQKAAERMAVWWEDAIKDWCVLRGEDTLCVCVEVGGVVSQWDVGGVQGRYMAKKRED